MQLQTDSMNLIDELKILLIFVRYADKDGNINFESIKTSNDFSLKQINGNELDSYLFEKDKEGIIRYEEIGEDGFAPIIMASLTEKTHSYIDSKLEEIGLKMTSLENRISNILTFDPLRLSKDIEKTQDAIGGVKLEINKNEVLKTLTKPLNDISLHFESVKKVAENYEEIYKNIIRPVQEEGKAGVKLQSSGRS
jgi:hypothetical protein